MGLFPCTGCRALQAQVTAFQAERERWEKERETLRTEARQERKQLLDRIMSLTDPAALQHTRATEEPVSTWAQDEHGTTLVKNGKEILLPPGARAFVDEEGNPCVVFDGQKIPYEQYERLMDRMNEEAAGLSPGAEWPTPPA